MRTSEKYKFILLLKGIQTKVLDKILTNLQTVLDYQKLLELLQQLS